VKIAKFDRPSFCQSAVVSTAPFCTSFSYLTLKNVVTLKFRLGITQSLEQAQFDKLHTSSHSSFIVTTAVFCIVYEIKRDKGRQSQFFSRPLRESKWWSQSSRSASLIISFCCTVFLGPIIVYIENVSNMFSYMHIDVICLRMHAKQWTFWRRSWHGFLTSAIDHYSRQFS